MREKVILHLYRLRAFNEAFEVPHSMCQVGIAEGTGVRRSHASSILKGLRESGLVEERVAHIRGGRRRRKIYFMTFKGMAEGSKILEGLEKAGIPLDSVLATSSEAAETPSDSGRVPEIKYFFGREAELESFGEWLDSGISRVFVVQGIAGIGKTTLFAKAAAISSEKNDRIVFWYTIREWSGLHSLLVELTGFLSEMGIPSLSKVIGRDRPVDIESSAKALLGAGDVLLVLDDVHNADDRIVQFLKALIQTDVRTPAGKSKTFKLAVAGRHIPNFYSRRDTKVHGKVTELKLEGLAPEDGEKLYRAVVDGGDFERIYHLSKGHPLSIELIGLAGGSPVDSTRFIFEEIYGGLAQGQRDTLKAASVFREPVPIEALFIGEGVSFSAIDDLIHRGLLRTTGNDVVVHELIREFFGKRLQPDVQKRLHQRAAQFYLEEGSERSWLEAHYHLISIGDRERSAGLLMTRVSELLRKGFHEEILHIIDELGEKEVGDKVVDVLKIRAEIQNLYGEWAAAKKTCERMMELATQLNDKRSEIQGGILLGAIAYNLEDWDEAIRMYKEALRSADSIEDRESSSKVYNNLGILYWRQGDLPEALRCYNKSLAIAEEMDDGPGVARIQANLGIIYHQNGDYDKALESYNRSLEISEKSGDKKTASILHGNIGELYMHRGDIDEARRSFDRSLELAEAVGFKQQIDEVRKNLRALEG